MKLKDLTKTVLLPAVIAFSLLFGFTGCGKNMEGIFNTENEMKQLKKEQKKEEKREQKKEAAENGDSQGANKANKAPKKQK